MPIPILLPNNQDVDSLLSLSLSLTWPIYHGMCVLSSARLKSLFYNNPEKEIMNRMMRRTRAPIIYTYTTSISASSWFTYISNIYNKLLCVYMLRHEAVSFFRVEPTKTANC
jgi:hypothetical protein